MQFVWWCLLYVAVGVLATALVEGYKTYKNGTPYPVEAEVYLIFAWLPAAFLVSVVALIAVVVFTGKLLGTACRSFCS